MPVTIELQQVLLGLKPYVLIEFFKGDEGDDDLRASVRAGGGVSTVSEIREALTLALESLPTEEPTTDETTTEEGK